MIVDLAHASSATIEDTRHVLTEPVIVSHTGVQKSCNPAAGCEPERNLSDEELVNIANRGGLVGIGYWPAAVGRSVGGIVDAMEHVMRVLERAEVADPAAHLGLGSDFDGAVTVPFTADGLETLTAAMRARGFSERAIRKIAGINACRLIAARLLAASTLRYPANFREICDLRLPSRSKVALPN
jgi:microsomal dipeptidase-like Zn-dependent dipeptidase